MLMRDKVSMHIETCVLLSWKAPDAEIKIRLDMSELDITSAEGKAKVPQVTAKKREAIIDY